MKSRREFLVSDILVLLSVEERLSRVFANVLFITTEA